jgi:hypothetical protein
MSKSKTFMVTAFVGLIALSLAAEARRGFSGGGSGSGSYDNQTPSVWLATDTADADCQTLYNKDCSDLTAAQLEDVTAQNTVATSNNYGSHTDFVDAGTHGYTASPADGTLWTAAKAQSGAFNTDCDNSYSSTGGCDAVSKSNYASISGSSGRTAALAAGFTSYDDYLSASALGYLQSSADGSLWVQANNGSVSSAACDAEFPGKTCAELSKSSFESAKASNALMTAKIAKVTAGTLTSADLLTDLGISLSSSSLTDPIAAWQLDYLESILSTTSGTAKATWQTSIDNYNAASANAWYLWKIAASSAASGTYATSNATYTVFKAAGVDTGTTGTSAVCNVGGAVAAGITCGVLGVTNAQIAADIRNAGFSAAPTSTAMRNFLTVASGFPDGTTYADVNTATGSNSWSIADYKTATNSSGWTNSSADNTAFGSCKTSTNSSTGGASSCSATNAEWTSIAATIAAAADSSTDISSSDVTNILSAVSVTAHSFFDSSDTVMMGYLNNCISGASDAVDAVANCVSAGTGGSGGITETVLRNKVTAFKLGKIAASNSGSYTTSTVTQSDMVNIGLASNESNIIGQNYCGTAGNSSCLSTVSSALASASLTANSSAGAVATWINTTMKSHFQNSVAANQSAPASPSSSGDACSSSNTTNTVTMPLIGGCNHSSWTCTFASKTPSSLTLDLADGNVKLVVSDGGPVTGVSYTIRKSLNYSNSSYHKDFSYSMNIPASSNASSSVQLTTHSGAGNKAITPWNHCLAKGVGWELAESSEVSTTLKNAAPNTKIYAKVGTTARTVPVCNGSGWSNNNLITNWETWRNHSSTSYRVKYRNSSDTLINGACRSNSGGGSNSFWCRNATVYSCN